MSGIFSKKVEFLKGVGTERAALLNTELQIFTFGDLLQHFPFRHEDRSKFYTVAEVHEGLPYVQVVGTLRYTETVGEGPKKRLVGYLADETGVLELVWFQGVTWLAKSLKPGTQYVAFGKPAAFKNVVNITHPEMEVFTQAHVAGANAFVPVYHTTEKMKKKFLDSRALGKLMKVLLEQVYDHIAETLPDYILEQYKFLSRKEAVAQIHFPKDARLLQHAEARLKFEELFVLQLKLCGQQQFRHVKYRGQIFKHLPTLHRFYKELLPFDLTDAQKRVLREIHQDMQSGYQMNRLLQGDVGSGKTIVGFLCMLMAIDNGAQACLMAPTEILAEQHYNGLKPFADALGLRMAKLTGSSKQAERKALALGLESGEINIVVGTHALLEDHVVFKNLGLCIIDEQHRFGVAQRKKLWEKQAETYPHVLVMTATPIPRTLAMTLYGDLSVSVIDELPKGRKPIVTHHWYDSQRLRIFGFMKEQIAQGRQAYMVYPLIEESEKLDYKNLMDGFEAITRAFPEYHVSIVHGKQKTQDKDFEMQRFVKGETQIMVATTVIEVGVNVPNASVMVIENAEKFGLAQLHQLRGRVGRGAAQSYCILVTSNKISKEGKMRLDTMVRTNNGFEIADVDLKLRGPGMIDGTQQSGVLDLKFADLARDAAVLQEARKLATALIESDPALEKPEHRLLRTHPQLAQAKETSWSRIS